VDVSRFESCRSQVWRWLLSDEWWFIAASESYITTNGQSPVRVEIKHWSWAFDQIFITVRQLRVCWCGALSPKRVRLCRLQLLPVLASTSILESRGTRYHILLSQIRNFPFRRLLRLAGLRWRYSTPPPYRSESLLLHSSTQSSFDLNVERSLGSTVVLPCCTDLFPRILDYLAVA
jgi:hypothetical protein